MGESNLMWQLNRLTLGYINFATILLAITGCSSLSVVTKINPAIQNDHPKPLCLEQLGKFIFENIDYKSIKAITGREIGLYARNQFDSTLKSESGIKNCPVYTTEMEQGYQVLSIDSIVFKKQNPASNLGQGSSGITFTYQADFQFKANAYFNLVDSAKTLKGETEYKSKIWVDDYVELRDAARIVAKDISTHLSKPNNKI